MKLSDHRRALSTSAAVLSLVASSSAQAAAACKDGLHVIVARASNEPQGYGVLMSVANNITRSVPDSDMVSVDYPATIDNYANSQATGVTNLAQMIRNYGEQCPGHRMAVLGYSQGAQVVGDALIGAQYDNVASLTTKPGLEQKYIDSVCGVVMMGDPANVAGQSYHVGSSTQNGYYPRSNAQAFYSSGLASRMQSYCDADDTYCDTGSSSAVHKGYVPEYGCAAAEFVVNNCNSTGTGPAKPSYAVPAPIKPGASKPPVANPSYPAAPPAHPSYPAAPPAHPSYPAAPPAHPSYPAAPPAHPSYPAAPPAHPSYPAAPPPVVRPSVPASVAPPAVRPSLPPSRPSVPASGAPSMARPSLPPASGSPSMARPSLPPASGSHSMARPSLPPHASAPASTARPSLPPPSAPPASMARPSLPPHSAPASVPRPSLPPMSRPPVSMPHASVPAPVQPSVPASISMSISMPRRAMNMTVSAPSKSNNTGTIVETAPDVTPSPTSNGDQGIYTTRATASPTGGASSNSASVVAAGLTVVLGSVLALALNL